MAELGDLQEWGSLLIKTLNLKSWPIGLKFIFREGDIPAGTVRPKKDKAQHLAQCQAFAMSRRQGLAIAMTKEDHWCWGPLLGYGLADYRPALAIPATAHQAEILPRLEYGKYCGLICAPLHEIKFVPDLALIYSDTAQLRNMLMAFKFSERELVSSQFDPIDSCIYSVVPTFLDRKIRITLPDPGESHRASAQDNEIILSLPVEKIQILVEGLKKAEAFSLPAHLTTDNAMIPDFPRPEFYDQLFKEWGLD